MPLHPNLKQLSHSSNITLHKCPRKFELSKILSVEREEDRHTTFGSAFGTALQSMILGSSKREAYWVAFRAWTGDLLSAGDEKAIKDGKTFWDLLIALDCFVPVLANNILRKYKVLSVNDRLANELGFKLELVNGFKYRGFVDVVLLDLQTNELVVLEIKTTKSSTVHPATFKNSGQALGYSLILDAIAAANPSLKYGSSYKVLYLIWKTTKREFEFMPFEKYHVDRANWLKQLVIDTQVIDLYDKFEMFPKHGEACFDFFRVCEFFDICGLGNEALLAGEKIADKTEAEDKYDFSFTLDEVIEAQLAKGATGI